MNKKLLSYLILGVIFVFGIWLRTHNLSSRYSFGWDQQDDAVKVMKMIKEGGFTLIGPRVAGPDSFFEAPWHYYFLIPFYYLGNGSPWSGAFATIFVGSITILIYFFVAKSLWGNAAGLLAAWGSALMQSIISWNVMYTPALTVMVFYLGNKMLKDKRYVIPTIVLSIFAGTTHLVPATLLLFTLIGILFINKKPNIKTIAIGLFIGSICLLPLLIFDIRHNFLNTIKIIEFLGGKDNTSSAFFNFLAWRSYFRGFSFGGYQIPVFWYFGERILLLLFVLYGIFVQKDKNKKVWYSIWFILPALILLFYHKNIPEYYFGVSTALLPLFISIGSSRNKIFLSIVFLSIISFVQVVRVNKEISFPSLYDKLAIVDYMINYSKDSKFNFSYNVPFGEEVGYPYLFSWRGKVPQTSNDARLYSLVELPAKTGENIIYTRGHLGIIQR